jgi:hypothetical protein
LISPLCARKRYGCARSQLGKVLVEKREWTKRQRRFHRRVLQVGEVMVDLIGREHPLVNKGAC